MPPSPTPFAGRIAIRRAAGPDLPTLVQGNRAMAAETEDLSLDRDVLTRGVAAALSGEVGAFYLLAEQGDQALGQLMITTEWSDWRAAVVWWIQSVYVWPEARGQGVYRALYAEVLRLASEAGVGGVRLYVDRRNTRAQEVYRRLGMNGDHYLVFEQMKPGGAS